MDSDALRMLPRWEQQKSINTEPIRTVPPGLLLRQVEPSSYPKLVITYPSLLVIDADEERAQRLARILTLANYHPMVEPTPANAFKRVLDQPMAIQAILLGTVSKQYRFILQRILQQLTYQQELKLPVVSLPVLIPTTLPLYADAQLSPFHVASQSCARLLDSIWNIVPFTRSDLKMNKGSMVSKLLPAYGIQPRVAQRLLLRNSHFRQMLQSAYDLMSIEQWEMLISDVGLAQYRRQTDWPPIDDTYAIPAEYLSCLNQAVAFSQPEHPIEQLRRWGNNATQVSLLEVDAPSPRIRRIFNFASPVQMIRSTLKAYTREIDEIRGEPLHDWIALPNGNYWLVHYSNLYAYGRVAHQQSQPMCHVWLASIEAILRRFQLDTAWKVVELECSCQTQTGHCLFGFQQV